MRYWCLKILLLFTLIQKKGHSHNLGRFELLTVGLLLSPLALKESRKIPDICKAPTCIIMKSKTKSMVYLIDLFDLLFSTVNASLYNLFIFFQHCSNILIQRVVSIFYPIIYDAVRFQCVFLQMNSRFCRMTSFITGSLCQHIFSVLVILLKPERPKSRIFVKTMSVSIVKRYLKNCQNKDIFEIQSTSSRIKANIVIGMTHYSITF